MILSGRTNELRDPHIFENLMLCIWDIWGSLSPRARHTDTDGEKRDGRIQEKYEPLGIVMGPKGHGR